MRAELSTTQFLSSIRLTPRYVTAMHHFRSIHAYFGISILAVLAAPAHADQTLTLQLPPSQAALDSRAAKTHSAPPLAHTPVVPHQFHAVASSARGRYPARGGGKRDSVVGRLGQLSRATAIYRERSQKSARLTEAPAGTYVAVQTESGDWYGVLMADGSTGWLNRANVHTMDYQVVGSGTTNLTSASPNPDEQGDIYPRSSTPFLTTDPQLLLAEAYKYLGVKYVWGGNTSTGIDCSGFIKNVFAANGYTLPRLGSEQMAYGIPVSSNQLMPGDRLYFGRRHDRVGVTHTGLYIGNGYFIHASSSRGGVAISSLSEPMFARIYVCARR